MMKGKTLRTATETKARELSSRAEAGRRSGAEAALQTALESLENSKAEDIVSIDIQGKSSLADYMVVASGRSHRHVAAVADHLIKALKEAGHGNARVEGLSGADWVLIDANDVIVHLFRPEVREFYGLERMWANDAVEEIVTVRTDG